MSTVSGISNGINGIGERAAPGAVAAAGHAAEVGPDDEGLPGQVLSEASRGAAIEVGPDDEVHCGEDMRDPIRGVTFINVIMAADDDDGDEEAEEHGEEFDYGPSGVDAIRGGAFVRGIEVLDGPGNDDGPPIAGDALKLDVPEGRSAPAPPSQHEEVGGPLPAQNGKQGETDAGDGLDAPRADDGGGSGSGGAARPLLQPRPPAGPAPPRGARPKRAAPAPAEVEAVAVEVGKSSTDDLVGAVADTAAGTVAECPDDLAAAGDTLAGAPGRALRRTRAQ